jgi:fructose-1,6-bisphosphatase II
MRAKTGTIRFVDAIHSLDKNDILVELMKKYNIE